MKLVLLSDTHTMHREVKVPEGDVLIHAGDLTYTGRISQFEDALAWLAALPHKHKVVIAGNHDFGALEFFKGDRQKDGHLRRDLGIHFLHDTGCSIDGVKFWGSPYTPRFGLWAYMAERGDEIKEHWDLIPDDTNVLVTHGPLCGFLDTAHPDGPNLGCEDLHEAVFDCVHPKVHVFGHIHGGYGKFDAGDTKLYNASVVNEAYKVVNAPHEITL